MKIPNNYAITDNGLTFVWKSPTRILVLQPGGKVISSFPAQVNTRVDMESEIAWWQYNNNVLR